MSLHLILNTLSLLLDSSKWNEMVVFRIYINLYVFLYWIQQLDFLLRRIHAGFYFWVYTFTAIILLLTSWNWSIFLLLEWEGIVMLVDNRINSCQPFAETRCPHQTIMERVYLFPQIIDTKDLSKHHSICLSCEQYVEGRVHVIDSKDDLRSGEDIHSG